MSYTNETTHYGIPLPLGTDKTTPMDYNTGMQAVDTALFGAKSDSDSALRKAQQVEEGLSQTDGNVTALGGRVTTLEGTSVTQGNAIQQNAQDIADVRSDALDMIEAKDEGTAQVASVPVNKGEYFRYNDVLYIATKNIAVGATIVPNTNCRATNVGTELKQIDDNLTGKLLVSVTADGVKNWSTLLDELYAVATSAISNKQSLKNVKLAYTSPSGVVTAFDIFSVSNDYFVFINTSFTENQPALVFARAVLLASGSLYGSSDGTTYTERGAGVLPSGTVIGLYV